MAGDAVEQCPRHLDRRQLAAVIEPIELGDRQKGWIHARRLPAMGGAERTLAVIAAGCQDRICAAVDRIRPAIVMSS